MHIYTYALYTQFFRIDNAINIYNIFIVSLVMLDVSTAVKMNLPRFDGHGDKVYI